MHKVRAQPAFRNDNFGDSPAFIYHTRPREASQDLTEEPSLVIRAQRRAELANTAPRGSLAKSSGKNGKKTPEKRQDVFVKSEKPQIRSSVQLRPS